MLIAKSVEITSGLSGLIQDLLPFEKRKEGSLGKLKISYAFAHYFL
jgi:hypothetical protein